LSDGSSCGYEDKKEAHVVYVWLLEYLQSNQPVVQRNWVNSKREWILWVILTVLDASDDGLDRCSDDVCDGLRFPKMMMDVKERKILTRKLQLM